MKCNAVQHWPGGFSGLSDRQMVLTLSSGLHRFNNREQRCRGRRFMSGFRKSTHFRSPLYFAAIGVMILCLFFSACTTRIGQAEKDQYYAFVTPLVKHEVWQDAKKGFQQACKDYHVHGDWIGPTIIDVKAMEERVETVIMQEADGIITQGIIYPEVLKKAQDAGIPVVLVDSDMDENFRLAFLGKDSHKQAELLFADVEKKISPDVPINAVIQVANPAFHIEEEQVAEIEKVFSTHPAGFNLVEVSASHSLKADSLQSWKDTVNRNEPLNVAINLAGEAAPCCYEVLQSAGLADSVLIYGVDQLNETMELIEDGKIEGSIAVSFYDYGYQEMKPLYERVNNGNESEPFQPQLELVDQSALANREVSESESR